MFSSLFAVVTIQGLTNFPYVSLPLFFTSQCIVLLCQVNLSIFHFGQFFPKISLCYRRGYKASQAWNPRPFATVMFCPANLIRWSSFLSLNLSHNNRPIDQQNRKPRNKPKPEPNCCLCFRELFFWSNSPLCLDSPLLPAPNSAPLHPLLKGLIFHEDSKDYPTLPQIPPSTFPSWKYPPKSFSFLCKHWCTRLF